MARRDLVLMGCALILALAGCVSKKDYNQKVAELQAAQQEIAELKEAVKANDGLIVKLEASKKETAKRLEALRGELEEARKKAQEMEDAYNSKSLEMRQAGDKLRESINRVASLRSVLSGRESELASLKERLADLTGKLGAAQGLADAKVKEFQSALDTLRFQNISLRKDLTEKGVNLAQLQQTLVDKDKSLAQVQQLLSQKTTALADLQKQMQQLQTSFGANTSELANLKTQLSSKDAQLQKKDTQINQLTEQIKMLQKGGGVEVEGLKQFLKK